MDGQMPQPENPTMFIEKPANSIFNNIVFMTAVTLVLGFGLGFVAKSFLSSNTTQTPPSQKALLSSPPPSNPTIDESKLPISLALLTNPIVYEWRGSVNGKLTKKDEHTFTLVDDKGNSITITDKMPSGEVFKTMFFEQISQGKQQESSLSTIPIGSTLMGDFFIFRGGPNTPVGSLFSKQ